MKNFSLVLVPIFIYSMMVVTGCSSLNKSKKGAIIGTASGTAMGAIIGKTTGNTALGAIIGAAMGGTAGAIIGNKMDKQAQEIKDKLPETQVIRVGEGIVVEFNSNVLFGFDKSSITNDAKSNLDKLSGILKDYPDTDIEIQGHTDSKGSESYNKSLSEERAYSVAQYLAEKGISNTRMKINGFGELLPKYINTTPDGRLLNRRVEFVISANADMKADAQKLATN